ncbi:MAG: hypothetical protein BWY03_00179 [Parcubacteria group bacterium ADurb.Bin159]|jgi:hypothetical protein|nr:MAG: hypothetical protein BWY03_00179 [Parcubacteria group bacterium ADurb.Bin159]
MFKFNLQFFKDLSLVSILTFILLLMIEDFKPGFVVFWFDPKIIFYIFLFSFLIYLFLIIFNTKSEK